MINYIEGPRCSGKTTKLLEQVKEYLTSFPEGTAVVISPQFFMSEGLEAMWDGDKDRVLFTTYDKYCKYYKHMYRLKTSRAAVFIDEIDLFLNKLFDCSVLTVTREV